MSTTTPNGPAASTLPADWPTVYLDELAAAIHFRVCIAEAKSGPNGMVKVVPITFTPPDDQVLLYRLYALLAVTSGVRTTLEQVHDAWAVWTLTHRPDHRSLVPFDHLSPRVQELDRPYRDAIAEVARFQAASEKPKSSRQVGTDPRDPAAIVTDLVHQFAVRRQVSANDMTLADRFADDLVDHPATPTAFRTVVRQAQATGNRLEYDFPDGAVAIRVDELAPAWVTVGFSFEVERWQFSDLASRGQITPQTDAGAEDENVALVVANATETT